MRVDFGASIERTAAKLRVEGILELEELEWRLEAEMKHSEVISFITKRVRVDHKKRREGVEATRCQVEEMEWGLAAIRAREAELSKAFETTRTEISLTDEQD